MVNRKFTRILATGLVGLAGSLGCSEYGNQFAREMTESAIQSAVITAASEEVKKEMGHKDYRQDEERREEDTRGNNRLNFFTFTRIRDVDGNGQINPETEIFGYNKREFKVREPFGIGCDGGREAVVFKTWTSNGTFCGSTKMRFEGSDFVYFPDVRIFKAGEYRITATVDDRETHGIDIRIDE